MRTLTSLAVLLALALPARAQVTDRVVTATLSTTGTVNILMEGRQAVSVFATGTCTGLSFAPQISTDGTTWQGTRMYNPSTEAFDQTGASGIPYVIVPTAGMAQARINVTALTASCDFTLRATASSFLGTVTAAPSGTQAVGGTAAHDAAAIGNPVRVAGVYRSGNEAALSAGDIGDVLIDTAGRLNIVIGNQNSGNASGAAVVRATADAEAASLSGLVVNPRQQLYNGTTWDRARTLDAADATIGTQRVGLKATTLTVTIDPGANTGGTISLPAAGAGLFHYITAIQVQRSATAALAGSATLNITTTNLGTLEFRVGDEIAAGGSHTDVDLVFTSPLRSAVANTATTLVFPAPGANVLWVATVYYYTGA